MNCSAEEPRSSKAEPMYSQNTTTAYIELYEDSIKKLASQYDEGPPKQPSTETEENRHETQTPER